MRTSCPGRTLFRYSLSIALLFTTVGGFALAVVPGVNIAVPKVTIVTITSGFVFVPNLSVVEQGDYVHWKNTGAGSHTTTSGAPCVADGRWNASLGGGVTFERRFLEAAGTFPYFCIPHCGMGMTGTIRVTTPILTQAVDDAGTLTLGWTGGGPTYQVFRSSAPAFVGSTPMPPAGGDAGTSFSDSTPVTLGTVNFYLIMNK